MVSLALAVGFYLHPPNAEGLDPKIIDTFIKEGDAHVSGKEISLALQSYSRAFLLDPQRRDARERLLSLADAPGLSGAHKADLLRLRDLMSSLNNISRQVAYYDEKLTVFITDLISHGMDKNGIDKEMQLVENQKKGQVIKSSQEFYLKQDNPLSMIISSLEEKKIELQERQNTRSRQFDRLRQLNKEEPSIQEVVLTAADLPRRPVLQETRFIAGQGKLAEKKSNEVVDLSLEVTEKGQELKIKDQQIDALKGQMDRLMEQVRFNEKLIQEKNDEILSLNKKVADFQAQLTLRQKMIQEKEGSTQLEEVSAQKNDLQAQNESLRLDLATKRRENSQLERLLDVSDEKIVELQRGVNRQSHGGFRWFWEKADNLNNGRQELARAQEMDLLTANKFKELVKDRDRLIVQKDEQITELMGVVEIYQDLLKEAKSSFTLANQSIRILQEELVQNKASLSDKNKLVLDAEYNLISLKKELTSVQTRLIALKNLPETKNYVKIENEMVELEDKMNNIHKFLLKQLDDFEKLNDEYVAGDIEDVDKVLDLNIDRIERK